MKKILSIVIALAMLSTMVIGMTACLGGGSSTGGFDYDAISDTMESTDGKYTLALVTDVGQLKDKGFNQGTWEGLKRYASENDKSYKYYQPANGNNATDDDRINAMNLAITNGATVIVAPGFLQATAMQAVATLNPDVKFIFIDGWPLVSFETTSEGELVKEGSSYVPTSNLLANVVAVAYQEEQSGFFAGYAAVMEGYTKLGYTGGGGGSNPACNRFGFGFVQGAEAAAIIKGVDVEVRYSYQYGSTFSASTELQSQIAGWYNSGTEVVFSCGGSMFSSVVAAADATTNGKIVGVDVDQSGSSDRVITSAVKGLRESVMLCLEKLFANKWDTELGGKLLTLGAAEESTGIPTETWSMENFSVEEYEEVLADVIAGEITIDNDVTGTINQAWFDAHNFTKVTVRYE